MATAADKKRWDKLHDDLARTSEALLEHEIELGAKYGHRFEVQWLSRGERNKLEKLRAAEDKVGDKIFELVTRISPRDWGHGAPAWWVRRDLTWEDAIRPSDEPLSVVVPGAYGYPDGYMKEQKMSRSISSVEEFKEFLEEAVILVAGESDHYIDPNAEEVHVAIVFNVTGYGPHPGAIYVDQNRFHAGPNKSLEEAHEILEEWEREHYPMSEEDEEHRTETFDGRTWTLPAGEFCDAIYNTKAEQFIDVLEEDEDGEGEDDVDEELDENEGYE